MFDNLIEDYGQFAIMVLVFVVGAAVYGGYLYYQRRQDMDKVNTNLKNVSTPGNPTQPPPLPNQPPNPTPQSKQSPGFVPSETFKGEKKGYVFKKGDKGLGYYKEK
jgi:hypothetical protein